MYKQDILELIKQSPLDIDTDIKITGRIPTSANSEFLTNKEQGDWAEEVVYKAINKFCGDYFAVRYGRADSISAGDEGFSQFYSEYQNELNRIGKKPDILIFKLSDFPDKLIDQKNDDHISKAIAALEIRSSAFLCGKYTTFMEQRLKDAHKSCIKNCNLILSSSLGEVLKNKNQTLYDLIFRASSETFRELDFRCPSWSLTEELRTLTAILRELKQNIKTLHKRDYLSITPKMEDIALVNRWIQKYNVKHYYLQVFFDKAFVISFKDILTLVSDHDKDGKDFCIERDVKNQMKTTIKINVKVGEEILGKIDMPEHKSVMKELDRGRLLFYVTFEGGNGYLNNNVFMRNIINA